MYCMLWYKASNIVMRGVIDNTPKPKKKWPPCCRRHFQINFRDWKAFAFWFKFHQNLFLGARLRIKSSLIHIMAWRRTGDKQLPELIMTRSNDGYELKCLQKQLWHLMTDDKSRNIFLVKIYWILNKKIAKFIFQYLIDNDVSSAQAMAWDRTCDNSLPKSITAKTTGAWMRHWVF